MPPNHYRLLDLPLFENNPEQIRTAAHRRLAQIAMYNSADDVADAAALRNYVAKVSTGLLDPKQKRIYDDELRGRLSTPIVHDAHSTPSPHVADAADDRQPLHRLAAGINGSRDNGIAHVPVEYPADVPVSAPPTIPVPVLVADAPQPIPSGRGSVWPWVAGIATLNAVALAGITVALLLWNRTPRASVPNQAKVEPKQDATPVSEPKALPEPKTVTAEPQKPKLDVLATSSPPPDTTVLKEKADAAGDASKPDSKLAKDDDADKSAATPKQNLPSPKKKKKKSDEPFAKILPVWQLPAVPSGAETSSEWVSAGQIDSSLVDGVSMHLDSEAADLDGAFTFRLDQPEKKSRLWRVLASPVAGGPAGAAVSQSEIALGQFKIDDTNLSFSWRLAESFAKAGQLRNSVLVLQHGSTRKEIVLRQAANTECGTFDFDDATIRVPLPIEDLPQDKLLTIAFKGLKGLEKHKLLDTSATLNRGGRVEKLLNQGKLFSVRADFEKAADDGAISLVMYPRYQEGDRSAGLTSKKYNSTYGSMMRAIQRNVSEFQKAATDLPAVRIDIVRLAARQNALNPAIPEQQKEFGELGRALMRLRQQEQALRGKLNKAQNLPKQYRALANHLYVGRLARELQDNGQLEFEVVSRTDAHDIVLLAANGQRQSPPAKAKFELPPNLPIEGKWINFARNEEYRINQGGTFQVTLIDNPVATNTGNWNRNGDNVQLSNSSGLAVMYEVHEGIELRSESSSLYRLL